MRYPDGHKEAVRARIVKTAAAAFRRHGLAGVSIPSLMKRIGLTHGGFYAHFEDRDALVGAAIEAAGDETAQRVFGDDRSLAEAVSAYLSVAHVDHPSEGCVIAALGTDGARQPAPVRQAFARVARGFLHLVQRKQAPGAVAGPPDDAALVRASTLVGAVVLARLVDDDVLAERLLAASRRAASGSAPVASASASA